MLMVQAPISIPSASNSNIISVAVHSLLSIADLPLKKKNCTARNANISTSFELMLNEEEACSAPDGSMSRSCNIKS